MAHPGIRIEANRFYTAPRPRSAHPGQEGLDVTQVPPPPPATPPVGQTKPPIWKRWWFLVIAGVVALGVISAIAGGGAETNDQASSPPTSEPTATHASTPTKTKSPATSTPAESPAPSGNTFGSGTFVVPDEIKPGTYRALNAGDGCYWERLKNFSGSFNAIIANGNGIGGPIVVTVEKTDGGFNSDGCGDWSDDLKTPSTQSRTAFGDGMFIVGTDIVPGTYRVDAKNGCYWERMRNFTGEFNGIIANDNTKGSTIVDIKSTDAGFQSQRCGNWSKV
jgi:hypothetical protein